MSSDLANVALVVFVPAILGLVLEEVQAELAAVQRVDGPVLPELLRKGREVPGLHLVAPQLYHLDVLHLSDLLVFAQLSTLYDLTPSVGNVQFSSTS